MRGEGPSASSATLYIWAAIKIALSLRCTRLMMMFFASPRPVETTTGLLQQHGEQLTSN